MTQKPEQKKADPTALAKLTAKQNAVQKVDVPDRALRDTKLLLTHDIKFLVNHRLEIGLGTSITAGFTATAGLLSLAIPIVGIPFLLAAAFGLPVLLTKDKKNFYGLLENSVNTHSRTLLSHCEDEQHKSYKNNCGELIATVED